MTISSKLEAQTILTNEQETNELTSKVNDAFSAMINQSKKDEENNIDNDTRYVKEKTNKEIIENMEKLFEDIKSVIKTGMTVEELEQLEKLLEQIKQEMKKGNYDKKKVDELLNELEKEIAKFKKEITGEAIIEANDIKESKGITTSINKLDLEGRIEQAKEDIKALKKDIRDTVPKQSYNQSELLQEIKEFQRK